MTAFSGAFDRMDPKHPAPYFYPAFYTMSLICIVFFFALIVCSVQLLRRKLGFFYLYAGLLFVEVLYFFGVGTLWFSPKLGMSISAATGVANGGLMFQFMILLPLWGPAAVFVARKILQKEITSVT